MNTRLNSITTSRRWLIPRQRSVTMPTVGLERDSRVSVTSLSAQSVSPTKTGLGSSISVHERLAAAFSLVSGTVIPVTSASVSALFTRGRPKRVRSANGTLKCTWFVFIVKHVNQTLSVSVIVRPKRLRKTSPTSTSSQTVPRQTFGAACSVAIPCVPFRFGQYLSRTVHDREVHHLSVQGDRPPPVLGPGLIRLHHAPRPRDLVRAR